MATHNIRLILMVSSLFIAMQISGNYAGKEAEEALWFRNICHGNEKVAEIRFYLQDPLAGENTTVYEVARASITSNSQTSFGQVRVFDDQLTAGPDPNSEKVGRAQGLIANSDFEVEALTTVLNIVFTAGEYSGSTISILGRNQLKDERRELTVVGGTGVFRFARGYAIEKTYSSDFEKMYDVMEFIIYTTYISEPSKAY